MFHSELLKGKCGFILFLLGDINCPGGDKKRFEGAFDSSGNGGVGNGKRGGFWVALASFSSGGGGGLPDLGQEEAVLIFRLCWGLRSGVIGSGGRGRGTGWGDVGGWCHSKRMALGVQKEESFPGRFEKGEERFRMVLQDGGNDAVGIGIRVMGEENGLCTEVKRIGKVGLERGAVQSNFNLGGGDDLGFEIRFKGINENSGLFLERDELGLLRGFFCPVQGKFDAGRAWKETGILFHLLELFQLVLVFMAKGQMLASTAGEDGGSLLVEQQDMRLNVILGTSQGISGYGGSIGGVGAQPYAFW